MKVSESKGKCDFCGFYTAAYGINDNLWWICVGCMDRAYGNCHCTEFLVIEHLSECRILNPPQAFLVGEEE